MEIEDQIKLFIENGWRLEIYINDNGLICILVDKRRLPTSYGEGIELSIAINDMILEFKKSYIDKMQKLNDDMNKLKQEMGFIENV